jgi:hypothetical protein
MQDFKKYDSTCVRISQIANHEWLPRNVHAFRGSGQVTYVDGMVSMQGSSGGRSNSDGSVQLARGEVIVGMFGTVSGYLNSIGFKTSSGNTFGPFGGTDGSQFQVFGVPIGFFGGTRNNIMGAIGFYSFQGSRAQYTQLWGLNVGDYGSVAWDDGPGQAGRAAVAM